MINEEIIKKLMALGPDEPASPINGCYCDFCTRKKKFEDNWCALCANVKMDPPKHWENCDMCDECEIKWKAGTYPNGPNVTGK